ncbi:MAG: hypothetical protein V4808_09165 [Pseudomonadota bacterium]
MGRDFDSNAWAEGHQHLSEAIAGLIDKVTYVFERLQAIEYDAPWERVKH